MANKTMKKLLSSVLVAAMSVSMLVGCGSTSAPAATDDASASTETAAPAATETTADGKVVINLTRCTFNLGNPDSEQVKKVEAAINDYIADKINVQINLTDIGSGEYTEKANLALANNEINLLWTYLAMWYCSIRYAITRQIQLYIHR